MTVANFADRYRQPSSTTGTVALTLGAADTGYQDISAKYATNVDFPYCIEGLTVGGQLTGEWETGRGHLDGSGHLVRSVVYDSSNGGSLVNFSSASLRAFVTASASGMDEWLATRSASNVTGTGATGRVAFWSGAQVVSSAAGLAWDGTTFSATNITTAGALSAGSASVTGALSVNGNTTLGDAIGDAVTVNAGAWNFVNDTTFVLGGGVNALNFGSNLLSLDGANGRIGVGTATPVVLAEFSATGNNAAARLRVTNLSNGLAANTLIETVNNGGAGIQIQTRSTNFTGSPNHSVISANHGSSTAFLDIGASGVSPTITVFTDGLQGPVTRLTITEQDHIFFLSAGSIVTNKNAFRITGTLPPSASSQIGSTIDIVSAAGGTGSQYGLILTLGASYTNTANSSAIEGDNFVSGTGTWNPLTGGEVLATDNANSGVFGVAGGATSGTNIGFRGQAYKGAISIGAVCGVYLTSGTGATVFRQDSLNIGAVNFVTAAKHVSSTNEKHVGVVGQALGGDVNVAGYFGLHSTAPALTASAALIANTTTADPAFRAQDTGTDVFVVAAGGFASTKNGERVAGTLTAFKPSDTSRNTTTTPTADPDLSLTLAVGTYTLETHLSFTGNGSSTAGVQTAWIAGATITDFVASTVAYDASTKVLAEANHTNTYTGAPATAQTYIVSTRALLIVTVAGTLTISWAQAVSSGTNTTLQKGSFFRVQRVS